MAINAAEAVPLLMDHYEAGEYDPVGGARRDVAAWLGKHLGVNPEFAKQDSCVHSWRSADVSNDPYDICDECGYIWQYTDGRGDEIPGAYQRRPTRGMAEYCDK
jgi:hypothetical protein